MDNSVNESDRVPTYQKKSIIFLAVFVTIIVLVLRAPASAHSPLFPEENHSIATAYQIDDPAKSWAIYTALEHENTSDYYKFTVSKEDKIQASLLTPESPSHSGFLPSFALLGPGLTNNDNVPAYVEVPTGYGTIVVNGEDPGHATYEAFTPSWFYEVGNLIMNAPTDGTYYVVVFNHASNDNEHNHNNNHETANYAIVVGYLESFTPLELIMVPYSVQEIYRWEGQNQFIVLLPWILVVIIGGIVIYWRSRRDMAPKGVSKWLAAFAGLTFVGSAVSTIYQMLLAFNATGTTAEAIITLVFFVISIILALFTLLYATRDKPTLTLLRRVTLIIIGIIALFAWSGLYFGPALVILAALVPPYATKMNQKSLKEAA